MDKTFEEKLNALRGELHSMLTPDSPKTEVDKIGAIDAKLDELVNSHTNTEKERDDLKTDYIALIKKSATIVSPEKIEHDNNMNVNENFEELATNFLKDIRKENGGK